MTRCGLVDTFGRRISYLRLSVTDRCDLRCVYCMSEDMTFLPRTELLTLEELDRLASAFIARGVSKIRLTGGEPLVRKGVLDLVASLSRHGAGGRLKELTLTTNGSLLARHADALARAGVRRVNVSLDTLDAARFRAITRRGTLGVVMEGLLAAQAAGLTVKLNAVALKGSTEAEIHDLIAFAHGRGMDLTLIETMPLGDVGEDRTEQYLPLSDLRRIIEQRWTLTDTSERTGGPARYVRVGETGGRIGFITPLTHTFCETCNRVRVSAKGVLYTCLGQEEQVDLRAPLRASEGDDALHAAIDAGIRGKPRGHDFEIARNGAPATARHMSALGG
ncbi:GTP 3',8-cyclase MoaA [Xanthobacter sp. DSM 24535]|uniref:GTP 3',8-cyclase MoaA n=1 Tax=Roseixanthobacter psychrophilus TaxID=3119917 RepID=UPI003727424D